MDLAGLSWPDLPPGRSTFRGTVGETGCDLWSVRGSDGPDVLLLGAVHGDEYEGPTALARLYHLLDPAEVTGTVLAIPVLNEPAFFRRQRCGPDGLNLARVFPGRADGSTTDQLAYAVTHLLHGADALVDLHAAGTCYTLHPWAGYGMHPQPLVLETQRRMATAFGLDFIWGTALQPGRTLSAASDLDVAAIYVEMTGAGLCREADVAADLQGVRQVLACLGVLDEPYPTDPPPWLRETTEGQEGHLQVDHPAPRRGLFQPSVAVWDEVAEGDPLGMLSNPGGYEVTEIRAERGGRVACLRTAPPVDEGEFLAVVVPV